MIHENWAYVAAVINVLGTLTYVVDVFRGKARPNRVTWGVLTVAPMIAFASMLSQGVSFAQSIMTFSVGFSPFLIFVSSYLVKHPAWQLKKFDIVCGLLSILGLLLWWVTGEGNVANAQSAQFFIDLKDYNKRKTTAPEYIEKLKAEFKDFKQAQLSVMTIDAGPPASDFTARVASDTNRSAAEKLAGDIADYLRTADIRRIDDSKVKIETVSVDNTDVITRADGKSYMGITAKFVDSDTTALVTLTQKAVEDKFTPEKVASYGLPKDAVSFNFGQESENQDSFKTLALAFPIVLLAIYVVLATQFRSLLQPLLIFMAIPFSLFGITLGLWLTDNAFSFFAMLGFFALIGLSIKNTILLTDYANQSRRAGMNPVDAAHEALAERFRPLVATSLTAIVSIIPLALTSPFWQGLAVVLMFGLLSSTLMVVTVFPYYYLAGEFLRGAFRRRISRPLKRRLRRA